MDPLANQPSQAAPQQPPVAPPTPPTVPTAPPPVAAPALDAPRPEQVTPPVVLAPERPVEAWPPAGTPAAAEVAQTPPPPVAAPISEPALSPVEAQTVGTEVSAAAGAIPVVTPAGPPAPGGMDGFVSPAAKEIKDSVNSQGSNPITQPVMSDNQADQLFQEEPATKARKKHAKFKKVVLMLLVLLVVGLLGAGVYVFFFGNKAADSYSKTSSATAYKEAFSQIESALSADPVNAAELQAGFNKLKVAKDNSKALSPVILGELNPNYKKAQEASSAEGTYKTKAEAYQAKYGDYAEYLGTLSGSLTVVTDLGDLSSVDLTAVTAEKLNTDLGALLSKCNDSVKAMVTVTKPTDLSDSSDALQKDLTLVCTESIDSLGDGILVFLSGKTGVLSAEDQVKAKSYLTTLSGVPATFKLEDLLAYKKAVLDQAKTLQQEAEAIAG